MANEDKLYELMLKMYSEFSDKFENMNKDFSGKFENMNKDFSSKFENMNKDFSGKFENINEEIKGLKQDTKELKETVSSINKTVIKIENEHGNKLSALFDGWKQNTDKLDRIEKEVSRQDEIILRKVK